MHQMTQKDAEAVPGAEVGAGGKSEESPFCVSRRVHAAGDPRRTGTVRYVGPVQGYEGSWIGVDWDDGGGKHDGVVGGVRYFYAKGATTGSLVRPRNLSVGITFMEALLLRYRGECTSEEEDEMYVLSTSNQRVSIQFLGKNMVLEKLSRLEELLAASLSYMGISSVGHPSEISSSVPNLKELDLTGNLLSSWQDVSSICEAIPALETVHLTNNLLGHDTIRFTPSKNLRVLVLNNCGITWENVETLKQSLSEIDELHLMKNGLKISAHSYVQGFDTLRILNLEDNCIDSWDDISKLSQLKRLEQLHLNRNELKRVFYPHSPGPETHEFNPPFENLRCLLLGCNGIEDLASVDSLNLFPNLTEARLSGNPVADLARGGVPRFILVARLSKVEMLNSSQVSSRERKESEIRYVRLVMAKERLDDPEEIKKTHPRFAELKMRYGIEEDRSSSQNAGTQRLASELISLTLKCVGPSMGEKPPAVRKFPPSTSVGKLKALCESFFKLKSFKLRLFLVEEGSPLPLLLDDDSATLVDSGIGTGTTILVDEEAT